MENTTIKFTQSKRQLDQSSKILVNSNKGCGSSEAVRNGNDRCTVY
jgi:hypothetical protein